jgi:O-antigen biosynthesis protein WbqP
LTKRLFDFLLSFVLIVILMIPLIFIALLVRLTSRGPGIHWHKRVGRNNKMFLMQKFRSMKMETPQLATHLVKDPKSYLTPIGLFLRKTSLDEIPQLYD